VLRAVCLGAQDLFAAPDPLRAKPQAVPAQAWWLAAIGGVLALFGAIWLTARQSHSRRGRWAWVLVCGVVGLPALASLWLLYPRREALSVVAPTVRPAVA
jgi:lipid-A-disaccharide synthase-like uncharacterized protein